jgi:predicted ATPase
LPRSVTSFLGRSRELAEVQERLQAARLLTLVGGGGCGKTRLALEVARVVLEQYPGGVWLVELASLAEASLVPNQLAGVLGVREEPGRPIIDAVLSALRERHLLLVLDNCEHLVLACAELADALMRGGPAVQILATSREGLGIAGEVIWRVPPLDRPSAERLFVDRAAAASSSFLVTERSAAAITDVCDRLDGTPLAIELAAARVALLSVEQISARLDNALGLLTTGVRLASARQQSLRATLDWSYGLLSETEKQLFERLSVFAGGWTLEAAEAVGAEHSTMPVNILHVLADLVAKSLVLSNPPQDGPFRYRRRRTPAGGLFP